MREFYPRKDESNILPIMGQITGVILAGLLLILLFLNFKSLNILLVFFFIIMIFTSIAIFCWNSLMGGKAVLRFLPEGIEFDKRKYKKLIKWSQIKGIKRGTMDLGERKSARRYYDEIEIKLNDPVFKQNEIWNYWNMLSFVLGSAIGLDERHWKKEDLDSIASFIESKILMTPLAEIHCLERVGV